MQLLLVFTLLVLLPYYISAGVTTTRCGKDWTTANDDCAAKDCKTNAECTSPTVCFANLKACSGPPPPPSSPPPSSGCGKVHTVTLSELNRFMGRSTSDTLLTNWVAPLNKGLVRYSMNCAKRIAVFLAQVRHETAGMTIFYQSRDNGAGTLHMTPSNWPIACRAVPEIAAAFGRQFPGCSSCSCVDAMATNPFSADATTAAKNIFSQPEVAILSGTWWFADGARQPSIFGWKGCGDLRLDSDFGLGAPGASDCRHTGYYQVTCCIFWTIGGEAGFNQRKIYLDEANKIVAGWGSAESEENAETDPSTLPIGTVIGIAVGCTVVGILLIVVVVAIVKSRNRNPSEIV